MSYSCRILADSITRNNNRLTTMEITYPRFVHSELMTHRAFSRNAASSRAIPVSKMIERIQSEPAQPLRWGSSKAGMTQGDELGDRDRTAAIGIWLSSMESAVNHAHLLVELGVHKSIVNRILEPYAWMTTIVSATEWYNFFHLRLAGDVQPELQYIAALMHVEHTISIPAGITLDDPVPWHLPLVRLEDLDEFTAGVFSVDDLIKLCVARCARVSYLTHDGRRDPSADFKLHDQLLASGHWSPFEHAATPTHHSITLSGNFRGWTQYRKMHANENWIWG